MTVIDVAELLFEILSSVLELVFDLWVGDLNWNGGSHRILSSPTFWIVVILILAGIVWWELR